MIVERIYTRDVARVSTSADIKEAARLMRQHNVGFLLVTGEGPDQYQAIGVVTDRDLVVNALAEGAAAATKVGQVMTRKLETVSAGADIHEAVLTMRDKACRRLAVTDEAGRIVGVLSVDDLIDGLAADLAGLARVMRTVHGSGPASPPTSR